MLPLRALVWKLLRDVRLMLIVVAVLLGAFQCLWAKITQRLVGELIPLLSQLADRGGLRIGDIEKEVFKGPGQFIRTLIGGERINLENAMDILSIGYVHPLMVTLFCIWAIGRAAGAIAGEIDRGTMELLLAQPLARSRLLLAHFVVDVLTIPLLCLSLWTGNWLGAAIVGPYIAVDTVTLKVPQRPGYIVEFGPLRLKLDVPESTSGPQQRLRPDSPRLRVRPEAFGPALLLVAGLIFAVSGSTMWISAVGRFRWRVLGLAVFIFLIQFLLNTLGQMWDTLGPVRPLTLFYYYQPQDVILGGGWDVTFAEWHGGHPLAAVPAPLVLFGVGLLGYLMALGSFRRRDLPAPL